MAGKNVQWGCCTGENITDSEEKAIKCPSCGKSYHYACVSLLEGPSTADGWKCPTCSSKVPKVGRNDSTPVRNVTVNRGSKRQAVSSPSPSSALVSDKDDLRSVIKEIIKVEFAEMLIQLNKTITISINKELEPLKKEIQEMRESMYFMNEKFEEAKKGHESSKEAIKNLELENLELKKITTDLSDRLNNLEQQSRSNNLEVQCVPENKHENVYNIIMQMARTVKCELNEKDILYCTRIAKYNSSSNRPRSIIVQLASTRIRDQLLAATIMYNKSNPQEKLNSSHLGYAGQKSPIYVAEHLSPTNRALHAATRIKAKEKSYKYVWVRNGKIFVRKNEGTEYIQIKSHVSLGKIV